jgi:hypothetical protein
MFSGFPVSKHDRMQGGIFASLAVWSMEKTAPN